MLVRLSRFMVQTSNGNVSVFATFMCVAVLVTIARSLAGYEVLYEDLGMQIEAGYRLVAGLGLTIHSSFDLTVPLGDITQPIQPNYLTWSPPFLSLYVAGALFLGLSLVTSLKLLFSFITLIGWIGWAVIGSRIMRQPLDLKLVTVPAHFVIACLLPLLFTPAWQGTDIILWAGTPFVILLLLYSLENVQKWRYITTAGLLFGFLYSVRYASAYLAIVALLIVARFHHRHITKLVSIYACFMAVSMVFILPTALFGKYGKAQAGGITEFASLDPSLALDNLKDVIYSLSHGLTPYLFWIPEPVRHTILGVNNNSVLQLALSVQAVIVLLLAPFVIHRFGDGRNDEKVGGARGLAVALGLTILSLLLFLALASVFMVKEAMLSGFQFVLNSRYYIPAGGASLFIFYYLGTRSAQETWSVVAKGFCGLMIMGFMGYCFALPTVAFLVPTSSSRLIREWLPLRVAGTALDRAYFNNELIRPKETIQVIQRLSAEEPTAIFFITDYYSILFDNLNPQLRYFYTQAAEIVLKGAYVSRSTKVYFVVGRYAATARDLSIILPRSGFHEFMSIPENGTRIVAAQLPAGFSF